MNPYEPILKEIALGMLETAEIKPNFSNDAFLDALLIFQTVLIDKTYEFQADGKISESLGLELKKLIYTYTGLDTVKLVENYGEL